MSLFSFEFIEVSFDSANKSMTIKLDFKRSHNFLNLSMIGELEQIINWVIGHLEINTIFMTSTSNNFGYGFDPDEIVSMPTKNIQHLAKRFHQLVYGLFFLPQTLVVDLKDGAKSVCCELAIGGDLRLCHQNAEIQFNHLQTGWVPCAGGIGLLSIVLNPSYARNWILGGAKISAHEMQSSGFIHQTYNANDNQFCLSYLHQLRHQSSVERIQTKRAFLESLLKSLDHAQSNILPIGLAATIADNWRESLLAEKEHRLPHFTDPRIFSKLVKSLNEKTTEQSYNAI